MVMNTWELSGALVSMGNLAYQYAKKADLARDKDFDDLAYYYDGMLSGVSESVACINGFSLRILKDHYGRYYRIWIAYQGDIIGEPWVIER